MIDPLGTAKTYALLVLALLVLTLGVSTCSYRQLYQTNKAALATQSEAIRLRNRQAAAELAEATAKVNKANAALTAAHQLQEKKDAQAQSQIADLGRRLAAAPVAVRVRNVACAAGGGGSGTTGAVPSPADAGAAGSGTATGVLDPTSAGRLGQALTGIEQEAAAYASCRATLLQSNGGQ